MTAPPFVTLLTDFGLVDTYAGVCEGVILRIAPSARVVHLSHGIPLGDIPAGARALRDALPHLAVGVHMAVVDPGVGSSRRPIALVTADGRRLVGPDNGLLMWAAERAGGIVAACVLDEGAPPSATFHGRDVFAPATARLALGADLAEVGVVCDPATLVHVAEPAAAVGDGWLEAAAVHIDAFGNVALAGMGADLDRAGLRIGSSVAVGAAGRRVGGAVRVETFSGVQPGALALLVDSSDAPALAVNGGNASAVLGLRLGAVVRLTALW